MRHKFLEGKSFICLCLQVFSNHLRRNEVRSLGNDLGNNKFELFDSFLQDGDSLEWSNDKISQNFTVFVGHLMGRVFVIFFLFWIFFLVC